MLAKFFHRSEPISFVFLMIWLAFLVFTHTEKTNVSGIGISYFLYSIGLFFFFVGLMFYVDFLIQRYKLSPANYNAHFFFLILLGLFPDVIAFKPVLISLGFILLATGSILNLRNKNLLSIKLFNSGFFLGIAYLIAPISILYLVLIYIGYFVYLKIIDKRLLIPIIGFITPLFLVFAYFYWKDQVPIFKNWTEIDITTSFWWVSDFKTAIPIFIYSVILALLTLKYISIGSFSELDEERNYKIIIAFLFVTITILLINSHAIKYQIIWSFFPAIFLIGNTVQKIKRNWLKESIFYLSLITSLIVFLL